MKNIICTFLAVFIASSLLYAAEVAPPVLKQIAVIEKDPLGKESDAAYKEIIRFATDSSDVNVKLNPDVMPWINEGSKYNAKLTVAFIAGNMSQQIKNKTKEDCPYEGLVFMFGVYEKIRKVDSSFTSEGVEYLISLYKKNKLKEHLAAVKK